jgi:uncharacterized membrane protein
MQKKYVVLVLIVAMSFFSAVSAYGGKWGGNRHQRQELLSQLPADKEMLFHQTMREVREKTSGIHQQIKGLKAEIKNILTAPEFNDTLFLEKMKNIQELHRTMKEVRNEAIVKLAKQFTQEEREILAELIPQKHRHRGGRGYAR